MPPSSVLRPVSTSLASHAGWLPDGEWRAIQASIPIVCVDLLLLERSSEGVRIGLILRDTPHQGPRWCLIGGRLLLNEGLRAGADRQSRETLGPETELLLEKDARPIVVTEYFSTRREDALFDPRQHAVALVFAAGLSGVPVASGEAKAFRWFYHGRLSEVDIGFGQSKVIEDCMHKLALDKATPDPFHAA